MKRKLFILLFIICLSLPSFSKWIETTGKITGIEEVEEGYYGYVLTYDIDKSSAYYNIDDELIEGPMTSMIFTEIPPIDEQEVKMKYDSEEPMFFEIIDEIKCEE